MGKRLNRINRDRYLSIGTMSGSSMDGIDAAIIETNGESYAFHISGASLKFSPAFSLALRIAEFATQQDKGNISLANKNFLRHIKSYLDNFLIDRQIVDNLRDEFILSNLSELTLPIIVEKFTALHALLIDNLLNKVRLDSSAIKVIGFHGQNLFHSPKDLITVQVGDGQLLADMTGITVVNNFRENDVKGGGQGAPFAPLYHQVLAAQKEVYPLAIVNCGGIANITLINGTAPEQIIGFDTGPGNVLIDRYIRLKTQNREMMDEDGKYGRKGKINDKIMSILKNQALDRYGEDYFAKPPPKSLDCDHFRLPEELTDLSIYDGCANLAAFTALSITESLDHIKSLIPCTWVLTGGGWYNPVILKFFKQYLHMRLGNKVKILSADAYGLSSRYMEAEIFAYLGIRSLLKLPISFPETTGVKVPTIGGNIFNPR